MKSTDREHFLKGNVRELDGMRGLAILAVIGCHTQVPFMMGGFIGVDIFFVLSGFLITSLLIKEHDATDRISLKRFYLRRVLRLAPALTLLILLLLALVVAFYSASILFASGFVWRYLYDSLYTIIYVMNWMRALEVYNPILLAHTWSLSIEEQFYILWPVALILMLRYVRSRGTIALAALALALASWGLRVVLWIAGSSVDRLYHGSDTRMDALLIGCLLGVLLSSNMINGRLLERLERVVPILAPVAMALLIYFTFALRLRDDQLYLWIYFLLEILTAVVILDVFVSRWSVVRSILGLKPFVWLGVISYGLYLWHYPVYMLLKVSRINGDPLPDLQVQVMVMVISLLVATLSYKLMERPILKLKKRL